MRRVEPVLDRLGPAGVPPQPRRAGRGAQPMQCRCAILLPDRLDLNEQADRVGRDVHRPSMPQRLRCSVASKVAAADLAQQEQVQVAVESGGAQRERQRVLPSSVNWPGTSTTLAAPLGPPSSKTSLGDEGGGRMRRHVEKIRARRRLSSAGTPVLIDAVAISISTRPVRVARSSVTLPVMRSSGRPRLVEVPKCAASKVTEVWVGSSVVAALPRAARPKQRRQQASQRRASPRHRQRRRPAAGVSVKRKRTCTSSATSDGRSSRRRRCASRSGGARSCRSPIVRDALRVSVTGTTSSRAVPLSVSLPETSGARCRPGAPRSATKVADRNRRQRRTSPGLAGVRPRCRRCRWRRSPARCSARCVPPQGRAGSKSTSAPKL